MSESEWQSLVGRYIAHVVMREGVHFLDASDLTMCGASPITDEERTLLLDCWNAYGR